MSVDYDAIVVGAGPAGSAAAIALARSGRSVALIERGPFPGSKNMYGGVVYGRILDGIVPNWWEEAPIQRWVTRRATMMMTDTQALTVDFRTAAWGAPPYNGATAYRPDFDQWLATHATAAGAELICSTTVTGVLRDGNR
ncbi:MAG: FAD-dependent oxidoreductase, partial [Microthrixaceae bacterium]|nr:FAD-dependent oxidoreductase [Microthrixaceae bacterium]